MTFDDLAARLQKALAVQPRREAATVIDEIQALRAKAADLPWYAHEALADVERDLDYLAEQVPVFARVSAYGLALLAAGVFTDATEKATQTYLEHEAGVEERHDAILAAAGSAVADERERQQNVDAVVGVLEVIGGTALRVVGGMALRTMGLPADLLG